MSGPHVLTMGDRGRLVIPAELRQRKKWAEGTVLIAVETESGVILTTRPELERLVQDQLRGKDMVGELLVERRTTSLGEDRA